MPLLSPSELALADRIRSLSFANPFGPRRVELEAELLGAEHVPTAPVKSFETEGDGNPNTARIEALVASTLAELRTRKAAQPDARDLEAVSHLALFQLYHAHLDTLFALALASDAGTTPVPWYPDFAAAAKRGLVFHGQPLAFADDVPGLFALFFQMARAFANVYAHYVGRTPAAASLRASMWESIFTHDLGRYWHALVGERCPMNDVPTLITGASGTGKEVVARAVGRSAFVPFDVRRRRFELDPEAWFLPVHLASLSPSVIESELFGHRRGAFTGALEDRASFLEVCAPYGAVFLDELGEIEPSLQVKLLRVLQTREFRRLGGSEPKRFRGRLVSATHRDLDAERAAGRFRDDLYFRLNADRIETPPLAALVDARAGELEHLVGFVAARMLPGGAERRAFAADLSAWIEAELGLDYPWPGNFRELEQCARAFLLRGHYRPERATRRARGLDDLVARLRAGELSADELLDRYCAHVHGAVGTYEGAARRLGLDRRTVKARAQRAGQAPEGRA